MGKKRSYGKRGIVTGGGILLSVFIIIVTVLSIRWSFSPKLLGDRYESHIFANSIFKLLSVAVNDDGQLLAFTDSAHYNDSFVFEYDEDEDAYFIYKTIHGNVMYLNETTEHDLIVDYAPDASGGYWDVDRVGNTMYYMIVNHTDGYAIYMADSTRAMLAPADPSNESMHMRLQ
ncbi:MAG: hypothetical protein IJ757_01790 [Clostridiales bacterium]|nr:hypothetical protein [Clostridiales bacterium]